LMHHDTAIGALNAYYPSGQRPPEIDMSFLRAMADQAASAVDYARLLSASRDKVALEERQRLARDLHDSVSQAVYGIALGARSAQEMLAKDPSQLREPLDYILRLSEAALAEMRALIFELRPEALEREGLTGALKHHTAALRSSAAAWKSRVDLRPGPTSGRSSPPADPTQANRSAPPKVGSRQHLFGDDREAAMRDDLVMNSETLTVSELLAMFGRTPDETRWVGFADSAEYLSVVTYVVQRAARRF